MIVVDGRIAFVTGLCVGRMWIGDPERNIEPWRDTGVEILGPAVADIERAFAESWAIAGEPLPPEDIAEQGSLTAAGDVALRVIATVPSTAGLYRLDQLVAALARRSLWLSDAYFVGVSSYVQALRAAALDGVDVRLLVPGSTDLPLLRALSRAGYQPLLEAGVRVFEWNGSMMHAKTAVADGLWGRVGSTNLNLASWMGNYELDVAVEDAGFARSLEKMFLKDLEHSTEVVLSRCNKVQLAGKRPRKPFGRRRLSAGGMRRTGAGTMRLSHTVGAALTNHRLLGHAEAKISAIAGLLLLIFALTAFFWPSLVTITLSIFSGWLAISLLSGSYKSYVKKRGNKETSCDLS